MKKKMLSTLLCLCMLLSLLPVAAFAMGESFSFVPFGGEHKVGDRVGAYIYPMNGVEETWNIGHYEIYVNDVFVETVPYAGYQTYCWVDATAPGAYDVCVKGYDDHGSYIGSSDVVTVTIRNAGIEVPFVTRELAQTKTVRSGDYAEFSYGVYVPNTYEIEWKLFEDSRSYSNPRELDSGTLKGGGDRTITAGKTASLSDSGNSYYFQLYYDNASTGQRTTLESNTCILTVTGGGGAAAPQVVVSPGSTEVGTGETLSLTANAYSSDGGILTYQWFYGKNTSFSSAVMMDGETGKNLNISAPKEEGTYYYFCYVTNNLNGYYATDYDYSRVAVTNASVSKPAVKINPAETVVAASGTLNLTANASATGGGDLYYQWYYGTSNQFSSAKAISGATGASLVTTAPATGGTYYYFCYVTHLQNGRTAGDYAASTVTVTGQTGMGNFTQRYVYNNNFWDVPATEWFYPYVKNSFEYGLVNGKNSANTYCPYDNFTVAEALKIAACVHSIYYNGTEANLTGGASSPYWYSIYVNYCISSGIINTGDFTDYNANCTRAQMAYIFSRCLPAAELTAVRNVNIPDCNNTVTQYYSNIQTLYNAGIVSGDATHSYYPTNPIKRSEVAKIVCTLILPTTRDRTVF